MTNEQAEQMPLEMWAIVEIFGHQKYAGHVSAHPLGTACLIRVDVPALEERQRTTKAPEYVRLTESENFHTSRYVPAGTLLKEGPVQGYTKLFGVGAIYCLTPCSQAAAIKAVEEMQPRPLMIVKLPEEKAGEIEPPAMEHRELDLSEVDGNDPCPCKTGDTILDCSCPIAERWGELKDAGAI